MLEVHAPHQTVHTWKDFVIHIVAISLGLLIAIGLEQTVEYFHRLHQLADARRELKSELEENHRVLDKNLAKSQEISGQLEQNMVLLRAAQASRVPIGRQLVYEGLFFWPIDGPWQVVKQNGSLGLMPHAELYKYNYIHEDIAAIMEGLVEFSTRMSVANAITKRAPADNFTSKDLEELVTATSEAQGSLEYVTSLLELEKYALDRDWP
jgi:hypothetical protein